MLTKLRSLFELPEDDNNPSIYDRLRLAAAVLLVEVARSDYERDPEEYRVLKDRLSKILNLDFAEIEGLISDAEQELDFSVSLHEHVGVINDRYTPKQKFDLICALWQVAYSDGLLHHYEEHLIRRLSDLLHVPHREFIRAKHLVQST